MSVLLRDSAPRAPLLPFLDFRQRFSIQLYPWQREAFGAATTRGFGAEGQRQDFESAAVGVWRLAGSVRHSEQLDLDGARVVSAWGIETLKSSLPFGKAPTAIFPSIDKQKPSTPSSQDPDNQTR